MSHRVPAELIHADVHGSIRRRIPTQQAMEFDPTLLMSMELQEQGILHPCERSVESDDAGVQAFLRQPMTGGTVSIHPELGYRPMIEVSSIVPQQILRGRRSRHRVEG